MHICDICNNDFSLRKNLKRHMENVHKTTLASTSKHSITTSTTSKESKHKCPLCQLAFVERSSLRRHERIKHKVNITAPLRIKKSNNCITFEPSNLEDYPLLKNLVPVDYVYKVICIQHFENDGLRSTFEIADCAVDVFFVWFSELEQKSKVTYRVKSFTKSPSSKIIFNKVYRCIHNTFPSKYRNPHPKHTGCLATLTVRIKKCSEALSVKNTMADNNVIMIPLKAIVTLYHRHNHMLVENEKLKKIQKIQCKDTSMKIHAAENKLNKIHFDKCNSPQKNTTLSTSQVSIKSNKINTCTMEPVKKLIIDDNKIIEPIENDIFESSEEYDKYILVENVHTQNLLHDNNESELDQLMSDYDTVTKRILQQFASNPDYFKSAIKHYTLLLKNSLTSKESLLNTLHSFGEQLKEKTE
ncbi:uncharacterized protein LOC113561238 isoform X1 [Rhopalosiphum maidis]|uniref:uncharacterized protein LOC113561238 isoform X1 n=2 Tax=Rhopalosiphum maidis TaxID=43146 RepID=UPI000EFECCA6|nr:uncharacterized protein LOC113561238 isoform X1 [Rhopalosiphum maidis]XP_026823342.1 uncharacterized protein LOC113561238 isoform X1 [Rhopalosiphum maidis]